ncbi:hypothetical protein PtB15_2B70 [Puccinia triticina]|nr:hypothetical protein PtB15_2B70 [Puccinia triticina]
MAQDKSLNKAITKSKDLGVKDSINLKLLRLAKGDPGMQDLIDLWLEKNQTRLYNPFLELISHQEDSLFCLVMDNLHQQPRDILEQHLPPGFLDNHVDAISSVNSAVKKQLKLIANSELPVSYTNAWHQLLGAQDAALFGHQPSLANLDQSAVQVSTDEEPLRAKRISDPPSPRSVSDGSLPDAPVPS